jgi:hypothetical protein
VIALQSTTRPLVRAGALHEEEEEKEEEVKVKKKKQSYPVTGLGGL